MRHLLTIILIASWIGLPAAGQSQPENVHGKAFDLILDTYVRDGLVYYRALKLERARLDAHIASLASASIDPAPRDEQIAFWLNAYNALVLKTVIDHYPIVQRTASYPPRSVRQIPGAFERLQYQVAGRMVTLDQIEQTILPAYKDPRVFFALGRGAMSSGRLRSEPYSAATLESQLADTSSECVTRNYCLEVDRASNQVNISSIFSWRSQEFIAAYSTRAPEVFASRSPIERAALAFVQPRLLTIEKEFLEKNQFKVAFKPFDWSLNDLTGRGGR